MVKLGFAPLDHDPSIKIKLASAGLGACIAEAITYPVDTAKVRLMIQGEGTKGGAPLKYKGLFNTISVVARTEGTRSLYSGMVAGFHRQLVVGSVRIGLYDSAKYFYGNIFEGGLSDLHQVSIPTRICAGITTGIIAVSFGQPTDIVKIRMQAQGAAGIIRYSGAFNAYKTIIAEEGVVGLWKGLTPNMMRTAIVNAAEIVSYDVIKSAILHRQLMSNHMPCHFVSALGAAFITTVVVSPVDVLKTRYMNSTPGQYSGLFDCTLKLWREKGVLAFYKGCVPNFCRLSAWNILMFLSYEQLKRGFSHGVDSFTGLNSNNKLQANDNWK